MRFTLSDWLAMIMFIVSLSVYVKRPAPSYLKYFPIYFLYGLIFMLYEEYTTRRGIHNTTQANIYAISDFSFLFLVIRQIISNAAMKRVIFYTAIAFAIFAGTNIFLQRKISFNSVNYTVAIIIIVLFCIYYYFELFQKTEAPSLAREPSFWIVTAIFFFNVLSFPIYALLSSMTNLSALIGRNIEAVYNLITVLAYILYSIGFLCRLPIRKYFS